MIRSEFFTDLTDPTERRIHGTIDHDCSRARIKEEDEAETEAGAQILADAERGTKGQAGRARGKACGRVRTINRNPP
jgi:ethanolamine utilization microcompartment shell protein EutL